MAWLEQDAPHDTPWHVILAGLLLVPAAAHAVTLAETVDAAVARAPQAAPLAAERLTQEARRDAASRLFPGAPYAQVDAQTDRGTGGRGFTTFGAELGMHGPRYATCRWRKRRRPRRGCCGRSLGARRAADACKAIDGAPFKGPMAWACRRSAEVNRRSRCLPPPHGHSRGWPAEAGAYRPRAVPAGVAWRRPSPPPLGHGS